MSKWESVSLLKVCDFVGGSQPPKDEWTTSVRDGYVQMLQIRDFTQKREGKEEYVKISERIKTCKKEDLLIARYGASVGKIVRGQSGAYNVALMKIVPQRIEAEFLYFYLLGKSFQCALNVASDRAAQAGFNKKDLEKIKILLPSPNVQKKIAQTLYKAQELIDQRKAQLEKLDLLVKSQFIEMLGDPMTNPKGWEIKKISELVIIDTKMVNDFAKFQEFPHIGINSIEKNTGKIREYKLVSESDLSSGKYIFDARHIIYSKIRPNLNKVALPNFNGLCSADSYPLLPVEGISNKYFMVEILRSEAFLQQILSYSTRTNIPKVNKAQLSAVTLPCPPFQLQNQFANFVEQVEAQKQLIQQSLRQLEQNYKSLMQKCFQGEIF